MMTPQIIILIVWHDVEPQQLQAFQAIHLVLPSHLTRLQDLGGNAPSGVALAGQAAQNETGGV